MPTSIPFVRRPYDDSASTARIADLIRHRGAQQADAVARSGALAGQMWANVGRTASGVITDLLRLRETNAAEQRQRDAEARETAIQDAIRLSPRDPETGRLDPERIAQEVSHLDPERAMAWWAKADEQKVAQLAQERARGESVAKAAGSLLVDLEKTAPPLRQEKWTAARTLALEQGLLTSPEQMPEAVDMGWLKQTFDQARTVSDLSRELEALRPKPAGTRQIEVRNPDGSTTVQIVPDEPGQAFTSAAEPRNDFDAFVAASTGKRLNQLPPPRQLALRKQWQEAGREPREPASEPLIAVIGDDGQPVMLPRSQAVGRRPASTREQGRPVTSGDAGRISELDTSLDDVAVLRETLTETKGATGTGAKIGASLPNWATELTGWGEDAKKRQGVIDRVKQVIGKALEGGVLRKEDEVKYEKILPTIADTHAVALSKLDGLERALHLRRSRVIEGLADAGYAVDDFLRRDDGPSGAVPPPTEGMRQPIPGIPGGEAEFRGGKWIRVK